MKLTYRSPRVEQPAAPLSSQPRVIVASAQRKDKPALMRVDLLDSYRRFYQFQETPFSVSPNPRMFYFSRSHAEALNHLRYGIYEGLGFTMITGEPGTGKTMLSRYFLGKAGQDLVPVHISHPRLTQTELLVAILEALGQARFAPEDLAERKLILRLEELLLSAQAQSRKVVVFVDEAQGLDFELLETLRLLSNLETQDQKLLQIVLFGQTELEETLGQERLRQMDQRILVRYRLQPLEFDEIQPYIRHQLLVARIDSTVEFTSESANEIYRISRGLPRMINALCERAMMSAFTGNGRKIEVHHVREGWESLSGIKIMGRTRLQTPV
jgi:general secretion pathway protein A